jgi:hypothetical protein
MQIVKVTPYEDRGLLRQHIEWVDGDSHGVADSHCALTGVSLGANWTLCVHHCRMHGHFSTEVNSRIGLVAIGVIHPAALALYIRQNNIYPETKLDRERRKLDGV